MKMKHYLLIIAALAIFMSCNKDDEPTQLREVKGELASLQIMLKGSSLGTKAIGTPTQTDENKINTFTVYVYNNNNGILEKKADFTPATTADYVQTVTGLTTGTKKIVIIANAPAGYTVADGSVYGDLANKMIDLTSQTVSTNLAMSGETTATLQALPATNQVTVPISRVVAKVRLGGVTLNPEAGHTSTFTLDSVYIMKARSASSMGVPTIAVGTGFYGGITGVVSQTAQTFLREERNIATAQDSTRYFYVFPNDNTNGNATLITLVGTYDGNRLYYPFRINTINGSDTTFINRNQYHTINVTLKRPANGVTDPETPVDPATLEVTIIPQDWIIVTEQNVEW